MIDFTKKLGAKVSKKVTDPVALYDTLDRASDKGPLRPAQIAVLDQWSSARRNDAEVIVKLHTGQGKTLIGLLMLQSKINEGKGPALYLCPNNYLINQTCNQARQFGINVCTAPKELPAEFLDGESILVTSVQKLFNGLSRFGTGAYSEAVGTILMDDSHACVDAIRDAFTIKLEASSTGYQRLRDLFAVGLEGQGAGSYVDICEGSYDALLPVPYWDWRDKEKEVVKILSSVSSEDAVRFAWPLIKDMLSECICVFSGTSLEISPHLPPIDLFGSYSRATHRIFMSATVTNDAFLVKGLRLKPLTIRTPLIYEKERWSGEKMILIPELLDSKIERKEVIEAYAPARPQRRFGVVAVTPSTYTSRQWEDGGASLVTKDNIDEQLQHLRDKNFDQTLVIANRYDGIDLPDDMCRILILDSKPHADNLLDRLVDSCRAQSDVMALRTARTIEQGIGRSVRGEKDYCAVILTGADLVDNVRSKRSRAYLSPQTRLQIEIGLEVMDYAREELKNGNLPMDVVCDLTKQCLRRDTGWKDFYSERMNTLESAAPDLAILNTFQAELDAEEAFQKGDWQTANKIIQEVIDWHSQDTTEQGWYLQEMARYAAPYDAIKSNELQKAAHLKNRRLLRPKTGMQVARLQISGSRVARLAAWVNQFESFDDLNIAVHNILGKLEFGTSAESFESALHELGTALGFACERPDKEWKAGPDNLWALEDGHYLLIECKSEVDLKRPEIYKTESGQMNNSLAWFEKNYPGAKSSNIIVIPTNQLGKGAGFNREVKSLRPRELGALVKAVKAFFRQFNSLELHSLDSSHIQQLLNQHKLTVTDLVTNYSRTILSPPTSH